MTKPASASSGASAAASIRGWTCGAAAPATGRRRASRARSRGSVSPPDIAPMQQRIRADRRRSSRSARGSSLTVSSVPIASIRSWPGPAAPMGLRRSLAAARRGEQRPGIGDIDLRDDLPSRARQLGSGQPISSARAKSAIRSARAARGNRRTRARAGTARARARRAVAAQRAQLHVEQLAASAALVRCAPAATSSNGRSPHVAADCARGGRSTSRCRRAARAAATSSTTCIAFAPTAGRRSSFSATAAALTCGLPLAGDRRRDLRASASRSRRGSPGRARPLPMTSFARPRDPAEIRAQGRDRPDHGALHGAAGRDGEAIALLVPVPLHRTPAVEPRLQPVGAGCARAVAATGHRGRRWRPQAGSSGRRRSRA